METYTIEQVNISDRADWNKGDKQGQRWNVGIRINSKWYNQTVWTEAALETIKNLKQGDKIALELYQEEYGDKMYDKFKLPSKVDLLEQRVKILEDFLKKLIKANNLKT